MAERDAPSGARVVHRDRGWAASEAIVEAHPELLSDEADQLMGTLAAGQKEDAARRTVDMHRSFLHRCREVGVGAAFAELEPADTGGCASRYRRRCGTRSTPPSRPRSRVHEGAGGARRTGRRVGGDHEPRRIWLGFARLSGRGVQSLGHALQQRQGHRRDQRPRGGDHRVPAAIATASPMTPSAGVPA